MSADVPASRIAFQFPRVQGGFPLRHAMSGRVPGIDADGDTGHGPNTDGDVIERNGAPFIAAAGCAMADLVISRQTHGTRVQVADAADRGRGLYPAFDGFPATDAMVTNDPAVALGIIVADCDPILLYDQRLHTLGSRPRRMARDGRRHRR